MGGNCMSNKPDFISEKEKAETEVAMSKIKSLLSVTSMQHYTEIMRRYPKINTIPLSLIGLYYVFSAIMKSELEEKALILKRGMAITFKAKEQEQYLLETNGWYIYADGLTRIEVGVFANLHLTIIEATPVYDIYKNVIEDLDLPPSATTRMS